MNKIKIFLFCLMGALALSSCGDDEESFPTSEAPSWVFDETQSSTYPESMSAVVTLPGDLATYASDKDQLAAFVDGTCRGVADCSKAIEVGGKKVYFFLIKGNGSEVGQVEFRYYSSKNSYMYTTHGVVKFEIGSHYGTSDDPVVLPLQFVNP